MFGLWERPDAERRASAGRGEAPATDGKSCDREGKAMAEGSVITEEMRRMIGVETPPYVIEVERGDLRRFVEATGETKGEPAA